MADGPGSRRDLWLLLPEPVRRLPADLAAVIALVLLTDLAVVLPVVRETPLRVVFGLPFVLFVPGYAFVAALFPEAGEAPVAHEETDETDESTDRRRGIDGIERVALSFGLSIAIVPLIGLILNFTPWGIRLLPILVSVSGFTLLAAGVAAVRRWDLPEDERFRVPYKEWVAAGREELFEPDSRTDAALNVLLVLSILLATASVGYAVAVPKKGEAFTEFYLLTRDDGQLVAADYPTEFTQGEPRSLVVGISNHEHRAVNYRVVVEIQRVDFVANGTTVRLSDNGSTTGNLSVAVRAEQELRRFQTRLGHNETWIRDHEVAPTMTGERLRLVYLLYRDSVPAEPTVENAYRELHLWVNVSAS